MENHGILLFIQHLTENTISIGILGRKNKPSSKLRDASEFMGEYPRRIYKAVPEKFWMNVAGEINGNYVDKRVEVMLK